MKLVTKKQQNFLITNKDIGDIASQLETKLTATQAETQSASAAATLADLIIDFNALLAKLKAAGIMA